jgi:ribulose-5-phosphate 4-epimerase/fuculose-1-phosphate aldolase
MLDAYKKLTNEIVNRVNNVVRPGNKTLEILAPKKVQKEFIHWITFGVERGFLLSSVSEVSIRLQKDYFLTHRPGSHLPNLVDEDLASYSIRMNQFQGDPNYIRHFEWHQLIYQKVDANAVVICHPLGLFSNYQKIASSKSGNLFKSFDFQPELKISNEKNAQNLLIEHPFLLIEGVGLVAWGDRLDKVLTDIEYLSWLCSFDLA